MSAKVETGPTSEAPRVFSGAADPDERPVTVIITRMVRPGREDGFESSLRAFIPKSLTYPGHLGVHMLRPAPGGKEFGAVLTFRSQKTWESFQQWPEYHRFLAEIVPFLESPPRVQTLCGLESWFTPLGAVVLRTPPRWKMAAVTWIGVCITVYAVNSLFSLVAADWPMFAKLLVANAVIVAILTWLMMPALTWLFQKWLSPER